MVLTMGRALEFLPCEFLVCHNSEELRAQRRDWRLNKITANPSTLHREFHTPSTYRLVEELKRIIAPLVGNTSSNVKNSAEFSKMIRRRTEWWVSTWSASLPGSMSWCTGNPLPPTSQQGQPRGQHHHPGCRYLPPHSPQFEVNLLPFQRQVLWADTRRSYGIPPLTRYRESVYGVSRAVNHCHLQAEAENLFTIVDDPLSRGPMVRKPSRDSTTTSTNNALWSSSPRRQSQTTRCPFLMSAPRLVENQPTLTGTSTLDPTTSQDSNRSTVVSEEPCW